MSLQRMVGELLVSTSESLCRAGRKGEQDPPFSKWC